MVLAILLRIAGGAALAGARAEGQSLARQLLVGSARGAAMAAAQRGYGSEQDPKKIIAAAMNPNIPADQVLAWARLAATPAS